MKTFMLFHSDFIETAIEARNWREAMDIYAQECGYSSINDMQHQLGWEYNEIDVEVV